MRKTSWTRWGAAWLLLLLAAWPVSAADGGAGTAAAYGRIDVEGVGAARLAALREMPGVVWWVELDDRLLVLAAAAELAAVEKAAAVERLAVAVRPERLFLVRGAHERELAAMDVDVLAAGGRWAVVQARSAATPEVPHRHGDSGAAVLPFTPDVVLARQAANAPPPEHRFAAPVARLIEEVDAERWFDDVVTLASFNRYTHNPDVLNARDWLAAQLDALPGLTVTTPSFQVGGTTAYNVVARWPGVLRPQDLYIIGAHYDSISENPNVAAPGAEDNASGCAGVLEMARVLTAHGPPEATVLFICYSGEEQGLHGSVDHASDLVAAGVSADVRGVAIMDMIGYTGDADLDCLLETNSANSSFANLFAAAAALTELRIVVSFFPFGSDHVPYLNRGMPALLTIENDWSSYPGYHRTSDLPGNISLPMGRGVLEMNVATMAELIGLEAALFADGFESGDTSAWSP